jgi:hypothetical protein
MKVSSNHYDWIVDTDEHGNQLIYRNRPTASEAGSETDYREEVRFNTANGFLAPPDHTDERPIIPLRQRATNIPQYIQSMPPPRHTQSDLTPRLGIIEDDINLSRAGSYSNFSEATQLSNRLGGLSITSNGFSAVLRGPHGTFVLSDAEREALERVAAQTAPQHRRNVSRSLAQLGQMPPNTDREREFTGLTRRATDIGHQADEEYGDEEEDGETSYGESISNTEEGKFTNYFVADAQAMMSDQGQHSQNPAGFDPAGFGQQDLVSILAGLNNRNNQLAAPAASAPDIPYGNSSAALVPVQNPHVMAQQAAILQDAFDKLKVALQEASDLAPTVPNPPGKNVHAATFVPNASTQHEIDQNKLDQNASGQTGFAYAPTGSQRNSGQGSLDQSALGHFGHGNNALSQNQFAQDMSRQSGYPASNFNGQPVHGQYNSGQINFGHNFLGQKKFIPDAHRTSSGFSNPRATNKNGLGQNRFFQGPFNQAAHAHHNQGGHPGFQGLPQGLTFPNAFTPHNQNGPFVNPLAGNGHNSMLNGQYPQQIPQDGTEIVEAYDRPKALFGRGPEAQQVAVQEKWALTQYSINPVLDEYSVNVSYLSPHVGEQLR